MSLLEIEEVAKSYRKGSRVALDGVSLVIEAGEMVIVWGERQSGRSTLLLIAAGIETPDRGSVRFEGRNLAHKGKDALGDGIAYCRRGFGSYAGPSILDQLVAGQLARRVERRVAVACAWQALERVGAERCGRLAVWELRGDEILRVALARALTSNPRLIVIDEPTIGLDGRGRDAILNLLRSLADEGLAILASAGEGTALLGADRVLSLGKGRLRGRTSPFLAEVTDLEDRRRAHG